MHTRIKLSHQFSDNITPGLQEDLLNETKKRIENFEGSYFKSTLNKQDAEIHISVSIHKNHENKYEGKFRFQMDDKEVPYHNDVPFSEPMDIVSHAFKRLKEALADS